MKDWNEYIKTVTEAKTSTGETPKIRGYILLKITDNFIVIGLVLLMLLFAGIGIFYDASQPEKTNWALHASELCLGVFLGVITSKYRNKR
jgi:hypothetical protein